MLEMMLMGGQKPKAQYPNSGPGPKTLLFGDAQLGYFGEITSDALLTVPELQRQLSFYAGTISAINISWVKVFSEGTVLYIPKTIPVSGVSWNELYNAGLVYGIDGVGLYPTATPTNQLRIAAVEDRQFKVRLLKNTTIDPNTVTGWTDTNTQFSEWGKLATAMIIQAPAAVGISKWGIYPNTVTLFMGTTYTHTQSSSTAVAERTSNNLGVSTSNRTNHLSWFPILELIPLENEVLLPVIGVAELVTTTSAPARVVGIEHTYPLAVRRTQVNLQINPALPALITNVTYG